MVAKLFKVKTSAGLLKYLEEGTRRKDGLREYYLGHGLPGALYGKGAERMAEEFGISLDGLTPEQWTELTRGNAPDGTPLVAAMKGKHIPGFDLVFAPPKSLSVELIYATDDQRAAIEQAHSEALKLALDNLERHAKPCTVGKEHRATPAELIVSLFTHYTSRPTSETIKANRPPDIGMHTHAFIQNMAWNGRNWRALDHRRLMHKLRWSRYVYESELTDRLHDLGYKIDFMAEDRRGNRTWELAGSTRAIRDFFSSRKRTVDAKVREFERTHGRPPTYEEESALTRAGREHKGEDAHTPSWEDYKRAVDEAGIDFSGHERRGGAEPEVPLDVRKRRALAVLVGPHGLTKNGATFQRYNLEAEVWVAALGILTPDETREWLEEVLSGDEILLVEKHPGDSDYDRLTTRTTLDMERSAVSTAVELGFTRCHAPSEATINRSIREYEADQGFLLDHEQRVAVEHLCSGVRWAVMTGPAGSGKTSVGRPTVEAWRSLRDVSMPYAPKVYGVAVAGSTAQRIAGGLGCDAAYTVEGLVALAEYENGPGRGAKTSKLPHGSLVILDEAVMADTPRFDAFCKIVRERNLVVRCLGDFYQLEAIGAGGVLRQVSEDIGGVKLTRVHRQVDWRDRATLWALRKGETYRALRMLDKRERLHESESYAEAVGALIQKHSAERKAGRKPEDIIVNTDAPNVEVDRLNRLIQDQRRTWGELGKDSLTVEGVLDKRTETFHRGDLIAFTAGYEDDENRVRVHNGARGRVTRVAPWGVVVRTTTGQNVQVYLKGSADTQPVRLAYAGHASRVQGAEAKVCLVLPWLASTDRGSAYSMTTRGIEELHVFSGYERNKLAEAWAIFNPKRTADSEMPEFRLDDEHDLGNRTQQTRQPTRSRVVTRTI